MAAKNCQLRTSTVMCRSHRSARPDAPLITVWADLIRSWVSRGACLHPVPLETRLNLFRISADFSGSAGTTSDVRWAVQAAAHHLLFFSFLLAGRPNEWAFGIFLATEPLGWLQLRLLESGREAHVRREFKPVWDFPLHLTVFEPPVTVFFFFFYHNSCCQKRFF